VGSGEELLLPRWSRNLGFGWLALARVVSYSAFIGLTLVLINGIDRSMALQVGFMEGVEGYAREGGMRRDLLFAVIAATVTTSFLLVRKLHNPGEIGRLLLGRYHYPEEEKRVFLFADLANSTHIAEELGHLSFSRFLRSCFSDVSEAILAWRGQVYQHAGDSVIVSWPMTEGLREAACLRCFFDMLEHLESRREFYLTEYNTEPHFRAGIHAGDVVTTWVGEARKDLAFHGETVNTTARLEAMCKELEVQCLASEVVVEAVEIPPSLDVRSVGEIQLRGRTASLEVFSVSRPQELPPD
jgi:adenylate cyclase